MSRTITLGYADPVDLIWLRAAGELGFCVVRNDSAFASYDGAGTITIGTAEILDADDCLAQMLLHEFCHALCEGPQSLHLPDWGIRMGTVSHEIRETACLRLQAALLMPYGLRRVLASTTDFRRIYDRLPENPLEGDQKSAELARVGYRRAGRAPWNAALTRALRATSRVAAVISSGTGTGTIWAEFDGSAEYPAARSELTDTAQDPPRST